MRNPTPIGGGGLSDARAIMMIMRVLVEEVVCEGMMEWILVFQCLFVRYA
jgi:hypothetical protein